MSKKSSSPSRLRHLKSLIQAPMMLGMLSGMWVAGSLGFKRQVFLFLGKGTQSQGIKTGGFKGYQPNHRDVFVCTYSKSGTNWALQIAYQLSAHGAGHYEHIHHVVPWPEAPLGTIVPLSEAPYASPTGLRVIKTHLEAEYVPYQPTAKYISIIRDPKEAFVSSYHFSAGMLPRGQMIGVEAWLELFLSAEFPYGSWAEHVAGYWAWRERPNVLLLSYHAMVADPHAAIDRIAELLDVSLSEAALAEVRHKSSFAYMRQHNHAFSTELPTPFDKLLGSPPMIRRGIAGQSGELLTQAQQAQIDAHCQAELARLGSDFPYQTFFGN